MGATGSAHAWGWQKDREAYAMTKGVLRILNEHIAHQYAAEHIRYNYLTLGWTPTEGKVSLRISRGETEAQLRKHTGEILPTGRMCERNNYMVMSETSAMMTGSTFRLTAGSMIDMNLKRAWQSLRYALMFSSVCRGNYVKKHHIFGAVGDNVRLPSGLIPLRAEFIFLHNNIEIASGARFVPHDAIHSVFSHMDGHKYPEHIGRIEIFDNVFIGANAILLGPCKIGPNAIMAAGAVVNKDVPPGSIVGGVPAKVIGSFDKLKSKRSSVGA